jgi:hypothetical protein
MFHPAGRTGAVAATLVALLFVAPVAWAGSKAKAPGPAISTSSGRWGGTGAVNPNAPVTGGMLSGSWGAVDGTPRFGTVTNTGTLVLGTASYTVTATGLSVGSLVAEACSGATWTTAGAGTCAGSTVVLDSTATAGATAAIAPAQPNAVLSVRLKPTGLSVAFTGSLSISVARTDVRAATTTFA